MSDFANLSQYSKVKSNWERERESYLKCEEGEDRNLESVWEQQRVCIKLRTIGIFESQKKLTVSNRYQKWIAIDEEIWDFLLGIGEIDLHADRLGELKQIPLERNSVKEFSRAIASKIWEPKGDFEKARDKAKLNWVTWAWLKLKYNGPTASQPKLARTFIVISQWG